VLSWRLEYAGARLASERTALRQSDRAATIVITLPSVRVRTRMRWVYRLQRRDGGLITEGAETVHVYPRDLLANLETRLKDSVVLVCDQQTGLPRALDQANVGHTAFADVAQLQVRSANIVLVGADRLDDSPFRQTALLNLARSGSSVMVFAQSRPRHLVGYALARRPRPGRLEWNTEHALFEGFQPEDLASWVQAPGPDLWAVRLPADEPALEIVYWPRETPGSDPVPIDALVVAKSVGTGRIVLCQLPLGSWEDDPRSHLLLRNALDYLRTRPEQTPRPSERQTPRRQETTETPTIRIPTGVEP